MTTDTLDPISLPANEGAQIKALHLLLQEKGHAHLVGSAGEPAVELPGAVYELLLKVVEGLEQGKALSIVPTTQELTTQQAADLLGVSRPYFVKLLEAEKLPFHAAGTHRRVYLEDVLRYKHDRDRLRHEALDRMAHEADKAGVYERVLLPAS